MARIELLLNEINQSSKEHIVVISHGFFLQMVRCLFVQKIDFTTISYEEFITLRAEPIVYLEGFEVIV